MIGRLAVAWALRRAGVAERTVRSQAGARSRGAESGRDWKVLRLGLVATDALALATALTGAGLLREALEEVLPIARLEAERHLLAGLLVVPIMLLLFRAQGLYDTDRILVGTREYARIANAATYGMLIVLASSYFAGGGPLVSRSWLLLVWLLCIVGAGTGRFAVRRVVRRLRRRGRLRRRVVIVGASSFGVSLAEQLRDARDEGLDVVGFLDEYLPLGQSLLDGVAVIGRPGDLARGGGDGLADEYLLVPQALPYQRLEEITRLMGLRNGPAVRMAVTPNELLTQGVLISERAGVPVVELCRARIMGLEAVLKRGLDLAGATLALALLAPLVLAALARAWLNGRGPLLSARQIYGSGGETLTLWLFERRVASWMPLRGAPALLAVLIGRLSLVGPRPVPCDDAHGSAPSPGLIAVKPGLTGPWRLSGPGATLADQALQDLTYVRNYTIWEDLRILWESLRRLRASQDEWVLGRWQ